MAVQVASIPESWLTGQSTCSQRLVLIVFRITFGIQRHARYLPRSLTGIPAVEYPKVGYICDFFEKPRIL